MRTPCPPRLGLASGALQRAVGRTNCTFLPTCIPTQGMQGLQASGPHLSTCVHLQHHVQAAARRQPPPPSIRILCMHVARLAGHAPAHSSPETLQLTPLATPALAHTPAPSSNTTHSQPPHALDMHLKPTSLITYARSHPAVHKNLVVRSRARDPHVRVHVRDVNVDPR